MEIEYKGVERRKGVRTRVSSRELGKILEYRRINVMRLYLKMFINNAAYLAGGIPNSIATIVISWSESMELASPNILAIVQYD